VCRHMEMLCSNRKCGAHHAVSMSCHCYRAYAAYVACFLLRACHGIQADSRLEGFAPLALEEADTVEAWFSLGAPQPAPAGG